MNADGIWYSFFDTGDPFSYTPACAEKSRKNNSVRQTGIRMTEIEGL